MTFLFSTGHLADSLGHNLREIEKAVAAWNEDDLLLRPGGEVHRVPGQQALRRRLIRRAHPQEEDQPAAPPERRTTLAP
jgi:hypothetical protein